MEDMECTVRKPPKAIGEESRLLEVEKLQQLVQKLQAQNERLIAAAGPNAVQNGDSGQRQEAPAVDPPRDSGIDLSASCSDDWDDDILDLDRFDLHDDEESWLYSTPAAKKQGDIISWLRKDFNSLNPAARRALAIKLEMLIARKNSDALKITTADLNSSLEHSDTAQDTARHRCFPGILDFDSEGLLSDEAEGDNSLSPEVESRRVVTRRTTFKVDRGKPIESAAAASATNSATFVRPKKMEKVTASAGKEIAERESNGQKQPKSMQRMQQQSSSPAATLSGETMGAAKSAATSPGRKATLDTIHLELNPDIHDIQLLASMQEEELRRCLQNLQEMSRRRRTSSGNQRESESSPASSQASGISGIGAPTVPVIQAKASDRFSTYTKPKQHLVANNATGGLAANKNAAVAARKASLAQSAQVQQIQDNTAVSAQKVSGLQKSLPNLTGSKSEFNLPAPSFPVDTASEKGSYGDIPSVLSPRSHNQATASSATRLAASGSRLPTPRSRLPTPAKSSIPMPRNAYSATPIASGQRHRGPATKPLAAKPHSGKDNWNEGCF